MRLATPSQPLQCLCTSIYYNIVAASSQVISHVLFDFHSVPVVKTDLSVESGDVISQILTSFRPVVYKLLFFTFAMVTLPIGTYFATVNLVFRGNSTYAGALAAVMANVVLIAYVVVAMNEDQGDQMAAAAADAKAKGKKGE